ncbi:hypothetical protein BJX70DRAFT_399224 [Aspergillus crustosus]
MATDPDGDSQMASSPESDHSISDADAGTRTPTHHTQSTLPQFAGASELSPPGSQSQATAGLSDFAKAIPTTEGAAPEANQPGASWMNKRAEEEYQRAMEYVTDLDFNLDEFGDPFDDSDMNENELDEPEIHFTPVKTSTVPRIWERKPSTSYLARSKPRKVWKRFRSSFNSMKALQQMIAPASGRLKESEFVLEINTRRDLNYSRGVKRQCLLGKTTSDDEDVGTIGGRGRSFLETKWESEISRKRRKLPAATNDTGEHMIVDDMQAEKDEEMAEIGDAPCGTTSNDESAVQDPEETGESSPDTPDHFDIGAAYPDALPGEPGRLATEHRGVIVNINSLDNIDLAGANILPTNSADGATENGQDTVTDGHPLQTVVATITEADIQERAMAVPVEITAEQESTLVRSALRSSLDGEDTELLNNFLFKAKAKREAKAAAAVQSTTTIAPDPEEDEEKALEQQVFVEIPTPERRVLEALDANSSSPQKSPSKAEKDEKTEGNESGSPVARRSTRVKSLQRAATPGTLRTTLSLRRATGKEFIFLQRTEAQERALETRRNTKQNKGDASLPKYTLQNLAKQTTDDSKVLDDNICRNNKPKKYVSWNEDRLAEFEGDDSDDELAQATTTKTPEKKRAASSHSALAPAALKSGGEKAVAAATTAVPRARRVRRLGPPKPLDSTLDSTDASSSPLSPTSASPIAKRKKLTPKSQKSLSKIPMAQDAHDRPSLLSGGRSVKTNLLKVNAGSTPMPRRVRRA